jgi:predicted metal-dependent hydrolase
MRVMSELLDPADRWYNQRAPIPQRLYPAARCAGPPPARLLVAVDQFNRGEFFECHETLEAEWNAEPGPIRTLYKGVLQVGVGCYHLLRGNYRGAILKLRTGADYLGPFAPRCMGLEVGALIAAAEQLRGVIVALGPQRIGEVDRALLPQIELTA